MINLSRKGKDKDGGYIYPIKFTMEHKRVSAKSNEKT